MPREPRTPAATARSLDRLATALFAALWLIVVANLFGRSESLTRVGAVLLVVLIALALTRASRHIRVLALTLAAGAVALLALGGDAAPLWRGLGTALPYAAFLPTVVILRAAVELSPTVRRIREQVTALEPQGRSAWMMLGSHLTSAIITLGFVSVLRPMLPARLEPAERLELARSGIRGLGMAVTWSPFFVAGAVASQLVPTVPAWRLIGFGLVVGAIGVAVAFVMFHRELRWPELRRAIGQLRALLPPTAAIVGAVVLLASVTGWSSLQSIVVAVPIASAAYILVRGGAEREVIGMRIVSAVGRMGDEVIILTVSAVFGTMVAGHGLPDAIVHVIETIGRFPFAIIVLEVAVIVALGFVGLHPIVSAAVLIPLSIALELPLAPQVLGHVVTLAWGLSSTIAIWTLPVVVASNLFEVPVRSLSTGPNVRFVLVYGLAGCAALALLNRALIG